MTARITHTVPCVVTTALTSLQYECVHKHACASCLCCSLNTVLLLTAVSVVLSGGLGSVCFALAGVASHPAHWSLMAVCSGLPPPLEAPASCGCMCACEFAAMIQPCATAAVSCVGGCVACAAAG